MRIASGLFWLGLALCVSSAAAFPITFSGHLDDPLDASLVASDLGPASFVDAFAIANNVALHTFSVPTGATVTFDSNGYAAGGVDPYFTLFAGTGPAATFVTSNYAQAFSTGGDFNLSFSLVPGVYTLALGVFANMSFAENGGGSLSDGFIQFGSPDYLGTAYYALEVTYPTEPGPVVPEPATGLVLISGLALLTRRRERFRCR